MSNPKTPVIVGVAQLQQHVDDPLAAKEPVLMMVDAVNAAADDAGMTGLLDQVTSVRVLRGIWPYEQPAGYVAEKIGAPNAERVGTPIGGNTVQSVVSQTALDLLAGEHELVVITGAEYGRTQARAAKAGIELEVAQTTGDYDRIIGESERMISEAEIARDIRRPIQVYPMFENALRAHRGESPEDHLVRISELWSRFSEVAAANPHAWIREAHDAETIRTPSPTNRMVSFPYPKLMNSNNSVDMAASLIMCTVEKAQALGIAEEQWVYPWAGTDAHDTWMLTERDNLYSSPAIRIAGGRLFDLVDLDPADVELIDIYSCFPSAVQIAADALGIPATVTPTVTGGLTFNGGPLNNYVMHSVARLVELLRQSPDRQGVITANGGYLTKHAFGAYSGAPPPEDFRYENVQQEVDQTPHREGVVNYDGEVVIETYTVMFGSDGPAVGHAACLTPDGKRTWANTRDASVMQAMTEEEFIGRRGRIDGEGNLVVL